MRHGGTTRMRITPLKGHRVALFATRTDVAATQVDIEPDREFDVDTAVLSTLLPVIGARVRIEAPFDGPALVFAPRGVTIEIES